MVNKSKAGTEVTSVKRTTAVALVVSKQTIEVPSESGRSDGCVADAEGYVHEGVIAGGWKDVFGE